MLISLIGGIIFSFYYPLIFNPIIVIAAIIATCILVLTLVLFKRRSVLGFSTLFIVIFFLIGVFTSQNNYSIGKPTYFNHQQGHFLLVKIIEPTIEKENSFQCVIKVLQNDSSLSTGKSLIYLKKSNKSAHLRYGDKLIVKNNFNPIRRNKNPYEFDYKRYLKIHDIHHQAYFKDNQWRLHSSSEKSIYSFIHFLRKKLDSWLSESSLSTQNQKVAKALFLGEKEFLDESILKSFSSAGAMHVLAVSGLHVGIIMLILQFVFKPIKKIKGGQMLYTFLVISGVWFYALITGFSPSVIRASLMFSFIVFGMGLQRQNSVYQSIFVSAFIILILDPFSLFKVGFQLSYLAVLGIVFFQPIFYRAVYFKYKIFDYLWQITSVSIAAQLTTFPLGLYYFHQFPNLFLISNIIVIPLAGILLSFGFMYFIMHFITPIRIGLEYVMDLAFSILNNSVAWIEKIPNSILWGISIHWAEVFLIYALIISLALGYIQKLKKYLFFFLAGTLLLLLIQFGEQKHISKQFHLTCYNIKNDFALDIFKGPENTFISTESLLQNESKLLFHVKHHWFHNRGNKSPSHKISIDTLSNPLIAINANHTLYIVNATTNSFPITSHVILYKTTYIDQEILKSWAEHGTQLILHPDLSYKAAQFCKKTYPENLIFDMREEGAFQLNYR